MAIKKNDFFSMGGDDISSDILSISVPEQVATHNASVMGSDTALVEAGLKDWEISGEFLITFGASSTEAKFQVVWALANKQAALIYRTDTGVVGATNPQWAGTGVLTSLNIIEGETGSQFIGKFTFKPAGDLTRTVA